MMHFRKLMFIAALFVASTTTAFASPLIGSIDITGTVKAGAGGVISFTTNPAAASNGTGVLQYFNGANQINFAPTFTIAGIQPGTGEMLFSMTKSGYIVSFYVTSFSVSGTTYIFNGYLTQNGVASSNATLVDVLGASAGGDKGNFYSAELTLTPEPNSIVLLGTGLLAACGIMTIKRRREISATA